MPMWRYCKHDFSFSHLSLFGSQQFEAYQSITAPVDVAFQNIVCELSKSQSG
jgi:hypothetical protein